MSSQPPSLDDRTYEDLLNEALARIPIHTPEWTNFLSESDPGKTLLELFAFLAENIIYRSNQIPERNRLKFLSLLGIPPQAASSARGLVTFANNTGPLQTTSLPANLEVRAGQVPFRTEKGLDVLPIETQLYYKRKSSAPSAINASYLHQLSTLYAQQPSAFAPVFYETVQLLPRDKDGVDLSQVVDNSLWVALLARTNDKPVGNESWRDKLDEVRLAIAGQTISLGIVPSLQAASRQLAPHGENQVGPQLLYQIPNPPPVRPGLSPNAPQLLMPQYLPLDANAPTNVLAEPGVVEISLPGNPQQLRTWTVQDPFVLSMYDFPPSLEDTKINDRLITWLRISAPTTPANETSITRMDTPSSLEVKLLWVGINTASIVQKSSVFNELLPSGTGEPDQSVTLAKTPVISHSVELTVTLNGNAEQWQEIDDLFDADAEVTKPDLRLPPGTQIVKDELRDGDGAAGRWRQAPSLHSGYTQGQASAPRGSSRTKVFTVDCASGEIRFGDGLHGMRLPYGAKLRADYAYGLGRGGNLDAGTVSSSSALPPGITTTNPVRTWGGADAETISEAEKQAARYLQHRDRLVTVADFQSITLRTPGVDIGRIEVLSGYNPDLAKIVPGDAPGAVTLMVIPKYDPDHPDAPEPDRIFLDTIADYLEPRRLITTEIFVCGPVYKPIWISVGIQVVAGAGVAQVREAVKQALAQFLSPLPDPGMPDALLDSQLLSYTIPQQSRAQRGWPLLKPVLAQELLAVASRVEGVWLVTQVLLAEGNAPATDRVELSDLELPHLAGMFVTLGDAADLDQVRGQGPSLPPGSAFLPGTGPLPTPGGPSLWPGFIPPPGQGIAPTSLTPPALPSNGPGASSASRQDQSPFTSLGSRPKEGM